MTAKIVILGAGFGGLELAAILSDSLGEGVDVTLIDKSDHFVFGFSKLDIMFGRETPEAVRLPYRHIAKPGVQFRKETITGIDPVARRVTTDVATHDADVLVVALGADYEPSATPGLVEGGYEFYSVAGAERVREVLPSVHERACGRRRDVDAVQMPASAERVRRCCCTTSCASAASVMQCEVTSRDAVRHSDPARHLMRRARCCPAFAERGIQWFVERPPRERASIRPRHVAILDRWN